MLAFRLHRSCCASGIKPTTMNLTPGLSFRAATRPALVLLALAIGSSTAVLAQNAQPRFALGGEVGTTGIGPVGIFTLSPKFTISAGYTWFDDYDEDVDTDTGNYTGTLNLSNAAVVLNWHPAAGSFHVSGGAVAQDNNIDLVGRPHANTTYTIGNNTYTGAQVGSLQGNVEYGNSIAPYLGVGWSKAPTVRGLGFSFDLGAMITGTANAVLRATGPIASNSTFQTDLQREQQKVNDKLDKYGVFPVVKFALFWRF